MKKWYIGRDPMNKRKVMIIAATAAVCIFAGGIGVYAYQMQQQKIEAAIQEEQNRLEEIRMTIDKELATLENKVFGFFSDENKALLIEDISKEQLDNISDEVNSLKENPDIIQEQKDKIEILDQELDNIYSMWEIMEAYNSLYSNEQLMPPEAHTYELISELKEMLKKLEKDKPEFFTLYSEWLAATEDNLKNQEEIAASVYSIYNKESGTMIEGVTRQQYAEILTKVDSLPDNPLKSELKSCLVVVDRTLAELENNRETDKKAENNSVNKNNGVENTNKGKNSGSGVNGSSGNNTSKDNSSEISSSENNSKGNGSSENNSSENNSSGSVSDSNESQSWEGNINEGGNTQGGGTWEGFVVEGDDFPPGII